MNIFKKKALAIQHNLASKVHELRYIFFELTYRCNLKCLHCGSDCKGELVSEKSYPDLPMEKVLQVLQEIKTKYDSHKILVVLSGGEPLVYPKWAELGKKIYDLEFPWSMVTNGFGWSLEHIKKAENSGLQSITVSLDGLEADHDWLRGTKGSFSRAINTIKMLVDNPFYSMMDVVTCFNQRNIQHIDEIYNLLKNIGVRRWRLFKIAPIGRAKDYSELFLSPEQFKYLLDKILEYRRLGEMTVNFSESGYLGHNYELKVRDYHYFCQAGISVAGIMVNGDILACPNIDRHYRQGNINTDSFLDIWENKYQVFRNRDWMKKDDCLKCKEWNICKGNSFHLRNSENGSLNLCHIKNFQLEVE